MLFAFARQGHRLALNRLRTHLYLPLYRNGYALVLSSAITSLLGMAYWILAARYYSAEVVGLNSAAISAMMFLAGISQLNLTSALIRFIPGAGGATRRLVLATYSLSVVVAVLVSLIFIWGFDAWTPIPHFVQIIPLFTPWFILATMGWCIFVLQDSVLTGLSQAVWVPVENAVFALVKIGLLVLFASVMPQYGVFAAWTAGLLVAVLPTNLLIFRRLLSAHIRKSTKIEMPISTGQISHFVAADYLGALCWLAVTMLMPVIVTQQLGARANAYFYLAWTIAYSLYLVSLNMGSSLTVEATTDQSQLKSYSYRAFVQTFYLLAPAVSLIVIGAPYILLIFGPDYTAEASTLLRLLALSALPNIVNAMFVSVVRVQRRMKALVITLAILCGLVLTLGVVLLQLDGITGVGLAWLIGQTAVAVGVWITQLRPLWIEDMEPAPDGLRRLIQQAAAHLGLEQRLGRLYRTQNRRRALVSATGLLPRILWTIPPCTERPQPTTWQIKRFTPTVSDKTVLFLGPAGQPAVAVLKLSHTRSAALTMAWEQSVLDTLGHDHRLAGWSSLLPSLLANGIVRGRRYQVEGLLPGLDARRVLSNPPASARMQIAAAMAIGELHRRTARLTNIDVDFVATWLNKPISQLQQLGFDPAVLAALTTALYGALVGRRLALSWIHGDFVPDNLLVTPDGGHILGIVDWEAARPNDLPLLDLVHLLLASRVSAEGREMGDVVRRLLNGSGWTPSEQALLHEAQAQLPGEALDGRSLLLLAWLRHVTANLTKSDRYAKNWLWLDRNVAPVLKNL